MNRAILIKSCRAFRPRQHACWQSWAGELRDQYIVPARVIEGGDIPFFGDTLIGLAVGDTYHDNSVKLREALREMLRRCLFGFVFVCDDDTFVHPRRWLAHEPAGELECRVFRPGPREKHRNGGHPWIHGGGGWWMSRRLCELYVEHCTERTSSDDILVANIARQHGIEMIDRPDLYAGDRYSGHHHRVAADNTFITSHHVQPDEMRQLYEATRGL